MNNRIIALALLSALLLTSCGPLSSRSYSSVTTHVEQRVTDDDPSVLRAESYQELVSSILHFVSEGDESGTVRLYQYTGDVESDLDAACDEIVQNDPLGMFALYGIRHEYNRIVSYYECTFTFNYRRTADEIAALSSAATTVSFREQLQQTMDDFSVCLAVRTRLSLTEEQIQSMVQQYYDENPRLAMGFPSLRIFTYDGSDSSQHILEVRFYYGQSAALCRSRSAELIGIASDLCSGLQPDEAGLWGIYGQLSALNASSDSDDDSVYDFLSGETCSDEAAALSALLLCQQLGLDARLVRGQTAEGTAHCWIAVCLNGIWYHMDPTAGDSEESFLLSDEEMSTRCSWDTASVPVCGEAAEETAVPTETPPALTGPDSSMSAGAGLNPTGN